MDKVELFGNIAHNLVPRVESLLLEVEDISAEPLQDLVKAIQICIEKISRHIKKENWSRQEAEDFFKKYRKLLLSFFFIIISKTTGVNGKEKGCPMGHPSEGQPAFKNALGSTASPLQVTEKCRWSPMAVSSKAV